MARRAVRSYLQTAEGIRAKEEGRVLRVMTSSGRYAYISDNCQSLFGFTAEELVGQSAFDQVFGDDVYKIKGILEAAQESPTRSVFRTRHKDRAAVWVEADTRVHDGFVIAALKSCEPPEEGAHWERVDAGP